LFREILHGLQWFYYLFMKRKVLHARKKFVGLKYFIVDFISIGLWEKIISQNTMLCYTQWGKMYADVFTEFPLAT
jgi:hypothetical protein